MQRDDLRKQLGQITGPGSKPEEHEAGVEDLRALFVHNVVFIRPTDPHSPTTEIARYNCYAFALGLTDDPCLEAFKQFPEQTLNSGFIEHLLHGGQNALQRSDLGSLVLYFQGTEVKHAGRLISVDRVISKWGSGHLWEHRTLAEAPESYGDRTELFSFDASSVYQLFFEWLAGKRGTSPSKLIKSLRWRLNG